MYLRRLLVQGVRNIQSAQLDLSSQVNVLVGINASGKSSILESIYILATGRSFRTPRIAQVIQHGTQQMCIAGTLRGPQRESRISVTRGINENRVSIDNQAITSAAELMLHLPVQLIQPDGHRLLEQGPRFRRQFLDWGVFHVEPGLLALWRRYVRALRQRNAALRQGHAVTAWHGELEKCAVQIHRMRSRFSAGLQQELDRIVPPLLNIDTLRVNYQPGWNVDEPLSAVLEASLERDRRYGHTTAGPQRADLLLRCSDRPAQQVLSRGQQKVLAAALRLAQGAWLLRSAGKVCIYLVDDLPAELDIEQRSRLMRALSGTGAQVLVTGTEVAMLPLDGWDERRMFHVKHGKITEVV